MNKKQTLLKKITKRLQISCQMADAIIDTIIEMDADILVIQINELKKKSVRVKINTESI